jgi:hypothetical protein
MKKTLILRHYFMLFFLQMLGVCSIAAEPLTKTPLPINTITHEQICPDDTLLIDFKTGIISPSPVYLGVTRFKEIKRMFGKAKIHNSSRYIFSPTYGFFPVQSEGSPYLATCNNKDSFCLMMLSC